MSLDYSRLTPAMRAALRDPRMREPLRFPDVDCRETMFDPDERQHVDRDQARALRKLLTSADECGTIEDDFDLEEADDA